MLQEYITEGNTVDEAVETGCEKLGLDSFDVTTEILALPKKGFFGKLKSPAKVKITYDDGVPEKKQEPAFKAQQKSRAENREKPQPKRASAAENKTPGAAKATARNINTNVNENGVNRPKPAAPAKEIEKRETIPGDIDKKLEIAQEYLKSILSAMGINENEVEYDIVKKADGALITLKGENLGIVIGRRGETLDAIQYLVSLAANRIDSGYYRLTIDCGDFREKRKQTLIELADKIADSVIKTSRSTTLEPMNPYERRIIHAIIAEKEGVISRSVGEEPYRKVVISTPGARSKPKYNNNRRGPRQKSSAPGARSAERTQNPKREASSAPEESKEKHSDDSDGSLYSKIEL